MGLIRTCVFLFLAYSVTAEDSLFNPCKKDDIVCLTDAAQRFLEQTSAGIPDYNIKPIDPFSLEHAEVTLSSGVKVHLKNVKVTGLKKLLIHNFKLDSDQKSVLLAMENDPDIEGDIEVFNNDKVLTGTFSSKGSVIPTATYNYDLTKNKDGVEYFTVGPENLTCQVTGIQKITASDEIVDLLWKNNPAEDEIKKKILCSVIGPAFHTVIHNLRASARLYPKTAYFTDL